MNVVKLTDAKTDLLQLALHECGGDETSLASLLDKQNFTVKDKERVIAYLVKANVKHLEVADHFNPDGFYTDADFKVVYNQ